MKNLLIHEIIKIENLPLRTLNICKQLNISSLSDIISYYNDNKTFLKANICGKKTNQDLINIYKKYSKSILNSDEKTELLQPYLNEEENKNLNNIAGISHKIKQLTDQQRTIIDNKIIIKINHLSARANNAIKGLLKEDYSIDNLHNYVLSDKYFNFKNIRNVGINTLPELENFLMEIKEEIDKIYKLNKNKNSLNNENHITTNEKLNIEFALSTLQKKFGIDEKKFEPISSFYVKNKIFPIFKMLDFLIKNGYIFNPTELMVFNNSLKYTLIDNQTVQQISAIAGLTGERIRQIKFIILDNFDSIFDFITKFDQLSKYGIYDSSKKYIYFDDKLVENISNFEEVNFTKLFYTKIFALFAKKTHSLIGNISINITEPKIKKIHNNEFCLVSKQYTTIFDFNSFIKDIYKQIHKRKTQTYSHNFENYISKFYYTPQITELTKISEICKKILLDDFNISIDLQGEIHFNRNTKKLAFEYLIDILEEYKRPMHFVELYKECVKRGYPIKSDMGVHSTLINYSDIFGLKGAGTFSLRKYGGYFGTIGNVAEKFLREKGKPIPLQELEKFINSELIISKYSIRMVLFKYKHENRFILDKNNFVILKEWNN